MTDPTTRELLIQLQAAVNQIDTLARRLDTLTQTLATTYVPRGEYEEARKGSERRLDDIEKDLDNHAGFRRQVAAGATVGLILIVVTALLAVAKFPGVN